MSITVNLHVNSETPINVVHYAKGEGEPRDRITVSFGKILNDVTMFLDRDSVARLLTQLTEERDWFSQQAADRIHAALPASECNGPACALHGVSVEPVSA